jgi:hypothetical protein
MALPSDLIDLLAEFAAAKVEYLLVGGHAVAVHGHPRFTRDADIWVRDEPENLRRACEALRNFGAPSTVTDTLPMAAPLDVIWMGHPPARIDLMKGVTGGDFEACWSRRLVLEDDGVVIYVVGKSDLIELKEASGRSQDLEDARALRRQVDEGSGPHGEEPEPSGTAN